MMKIISVVGARPNFMKIAPFIHAIVAHNAASGSEKIEHILVHTGRHHAYRLRRPAGGVLRSGHALPDSALEY